MAAIARTDQFVSGKEINLLIKKPGGSTYIQFGCITSADIDSPGAESEEIVCRSGTFKSAGGDIALPTLSLEHMVRAIPTADQATNVSDDEIQIWNDTAQLLDVKYTIGDKIGDPVYTGPGFVNGFSRKGPSKGRATGSFKFNFTQMPVRSVLS